MIQGRDMLESTANFRIIGHDELAGDAGVRQGRFCRSEALTGRRGHGFVIDEKWHIFVKL
jgi:hypothetical protein